MMLQFSAATAGVMRWSSSLNFSRRFSKTLIDWSLLAMMYSMTARSQSIASVCRTVLTNRVSVAGVRGVKLIGNRHDFRLSTTLLMLLVVAIRVKFLCHRSRYDFSSSWLDFSRVWMSSTKRSFLVCDGAGN